MRMRQGCGDGRKPATEASRDAAPTPNHISRRRQLYDATEPVARPQPVPRTAQRKNTSASCQEEARNQAYEYRIWIRGNLCCRLEAAGAWQLSAPPPIPWYSRN